MRYLLSFLAVICALSVNSQAADSKCRVDIPLSWKTYLTPLPKGQEAVLMRSLRCVSFGGEKLSPEKHACFKSLGCEGYQAQVNEYFKNFEKNTRFNDAFQCVFSTAAAKNCPAESPATFQK